MKIITISKIGYNHPSQANWSWGIWKIDTIDTDNQYNMSYTTKEAFGGDSRIRDIIKEATGYTIIETKGVLGCPNITGITKMTNMEDKEFINQLIEFIQSK